VFNPLTGAKKGLVAQIPAEELSSVVVTMKPPLTVFVADLQNDTIRWADKIIEVGGSTSGFGHGFYSAQGPFAVLRCMTHFASDVFVVEKYGSIISTMPDTANPGTKLEMNTTIVGPVPADQYSSDMFYLVESEGELLFVMSRRVYNSQSTVYRVDTKNRVLDLVRSIGSRVLLLDRNRCISIDSSQVPTVQAGNIYYADLSHIRSYDYEALS
jgi:hypothetical protein